MTKPSSVVVGQKWECDGDEYVVTSKDGEGWLTTWKDWEGTHWFTEQSILDDEFIGMAAPAGIPDNLGERAAQWLEGIATMLREKNKAYGNSLGDPVRIFTDIDPIKLTLARAEDKLSRIARGQAGGEDVPKDLVGYIALAVALGWNGEKLR